MKEPLNPIDLAWIYTLVRDAKGPAFAIEFAEFLTRLSYENPESKDVLHQAMAHVGLPMLLTDAAREKYYANRLRTTDPNVG